MKKALLCLSLLAIALPVSASDKNKPIDLTGSWKESRRVSTSKAPLDYTDTTFYDFMIGNEYTVQRKNSFMYRGTYKVTTGTLDLGMRMYNVLEMKPNRMLLKDDGGTYEFVRYRKLPMVEDNTAAVSTERAYQPDMKREPVRVQDLSGKWDVYKRTSSVTLPEVDYTRILRTIDIKVTNGKVEGTVSSAKDMDGAPSWKIISYEGGILRCTGPRGDRMLKVLKASDGELIIQEEPITYFFKRFK